jgi:hypothetical protein
MGRAFVRCRYSPQRVHPNPLDNMPPYKSGARRAEGLRPDVEKDDIRKITRMSPGRTAARARLRSDSPMASRLNMIRAGRMRNQRRLIRLKR